MSSRGSFALLGNLERSIFELQSIYYSSIHTNVYFLHCKNYHNYISDSCAGSFIVMRLGSLQGCRDLLRFYGLILESYFKMQNSRGIKHVAILKAGS